MLTKEELLAKGITEQAADEILAAFDENPESANSLELLEKALNKDSDTSESLFKAAKKDKDDDDDDDDDDEAGKKDDYDEEYMKKHMKKYMKENQKACGKMAKELGIAGESMKKAIDDIDTGVEGAVVEMADLAPFLDAQREFAETMTKAVEEMSGQISLITDKTVSGFDLMEKAARVQVEQAKALDSYLSQPAGKKGVVFNADMAKAAARTIISPENTAEIYKVLMKATKNGDRAAGQVISAFESAGKNVAMLNNEHRAYIHKLLTDKGEN